MGHTYLELPRERSKPSTKDTLFAISNDTYAEITYYKFSKHLLKKSDKYRAGRIAALQYASELARYYMDIEKNLPMQYKEQVLSQMKNHAFLMDGEYKDGLFGGLDWVLGAIEKGNL